MTMPISSSARPILIFGAMRSGTSLLSRLLNAHSRIAIPFESHLFNQWYPRRSQYGDLTRPENRRLLIEDIIRYGVVHDWVPRPDPEAVAALVRGTDFAAVARAIMEWAAAQAGKPRWGEKTPHHTLLHSDVLNAFPEAQVIMIERDPRDVALSGKQARFGGLHVLPFARAWGRYVRAGREVRAQLGPDRCCDLRYEALVRDPEGELRRIMAFLGEDYEPAQLEFHRTDEDWRTDDRNLTQLRRPISPDSIGRWKEGLSAHEVKLIESAVGELMEEEGYARAWPDRGLDAGQMALARYVGTPVCRALGLFQNRQGLVYLARDLAWKARRYGRGINP